LGRCCGVVGCAAVAAHALRCVRVCVKGFRLCATWLQNKHDTKQPAAASLREHARTTDTHSQGEGEQPAQEETEGRERGRTRNLSTPEGNTFKLKRICAAIKYSSTQLIVINQTNNKKTKYCHSQGCCSAFRNRA
jgi:hypothetical protein